MKILGKMCLMIILKVKKKKRGFTLSLEEHFWKNHPLPPTFQGLAGKKALSNNSINQKISVLNETIINVISNYIPNKTKVSDDQNPPWMNSAEFNYRKK